MSTDDAALDALAAALAPRILRLIRAELEADKAPELDARQLAMIKAAGLEVVGRRKPR